MTNARMFLIDAQTGEERELVLPITAIRYEWNARTRADFVPFVPEQHFTFTAHFTRRQVLAWRKIAGAPSGRRAARRRHHKRARR